jgi:hypothetical protein
MNGKEYRFPATKGEYASKLNGVYAVAGAESATISGKLVDVCFSGADMQRLAEAEAADEEVNTRLGAYSSELEELTSKLAGRFASGIRGTDFLNEEKYSAFNAMEIFAADKAAFYLFDSGERGGLAELNAEKAEQIVMLPVKTRLPETESRIMMDSTYIMYANASAPDEEKAAAIAFLRWFASRSYKSGSPLDISMRNYRRSGGAMGFPAETEKLHDFERNLYRDKTFRSMLENHVWDDARRIELNQAVALVWDYV